MSTAWVQVGIAALFALMCGALAAAWMRGRLGAAAIALFVVSCAIWLVAFAAIVSEYHGADGFADCQDECSSIHYLAALGFLAPPLLISLSALAMILALSHRWRVRRASVDENHV